MADNPLKQYFRQPALYLKLPTLGRWYDGGDVRTNEDAEIAIYGLSAVDDIMLNTPDAMLNGKALENVVKNCAPDVLNVKKILVPDLESVFLGIKMATNGGKYEVERKCPKCNHENNFEVNCAHLLDTMSYVEESDTVVRFSDQLEIRVRPYTFEMRQIFMQRQFEEERTLRAIDEKNTAVDEFEKARILAESVEKLSRMTFDLVSRSIESIALIQEGITVTDPAQISEWLVNISKQQADIVIETVNKLNEVGPKRSVQAVCSACSNEWEETLNFDPVSFFGKR